MTQPHTSTSRLLPLLVFTNLLTLVLLLILGTLYLDNRQLNRLLLEQRGEPLREVLAQPVHEPTPAPARPATTSQRLIQDEPGKLPETAEVLVVSGYTSVSQGGSISVVNIERPGKEVVLVLTSYERIAWQVRPSANTRLKAIIVAAYEKPSVTVEGEVPVYVSRLPYATDTENSKFVDLLQQLKSKYGIGRIDSFRGSYEVPGVVTLSRIATDDPRLSVAGAMPERPLRDFEFELTGPDLQAVPWTLQGPKTRKAPLFVATDKQAIDRQGRLFQLSGHELRISDRHTGEVLESAMPDDFPRLSWPTALAYDSHRDLITLVSLGGEGFIYRYDTKRGAWQDFRSLQQIDLQSLAYDQTNDRYVGWTSWGSLFFMSGDGVPLGSKEKISDRLTGFKRLYDSDNRPAPPVLLVPNGDQLAIVALEGNEVAAIWYYDLELDVAQLTYRKPSAE